MKLRRFASLLPFAVFFLLAAISWNRWIEPYVDSGRELMAPRRLAQGETLYRDVRFYHGPLGPYLAAGVERLIERSLPARLALAGFIALLHLEALRRIALRFLSAGRAALAVSVVVAVAFFLRPGGCHIFPFSLDTALATTAIAWAIFWGGSASRRGGWAAGGALCAALLSRPELGLAASLALLVDGTGRPAPARKRVLALAVVPISAAAAVFAVVSRGTPLHALRHEGWLAFLGPPAAFRNIYASYAGLDAPALRLAELALAAVVLALFASLLWLAARGASLASSAAGGRLVVASAILAVAGAAAVARRPPAGLADALALFPPLIRVVPPLVVAVLVARLVRRVGGRPDGETLAGVPDALLLVAALLSLRMLLVAGYFGPYNAFLLPLPLLVTFVGLFGVADLLARRAPRFPALVAGALVVFLIFRAASLWDVFRHPAWSLVPTPAGSVVLPEPVAGTTRAAIADLARRVPPRGTLTGFPEVGFLNYVLGLRTPLLQDQFFPGHLDDAAEKDAVRRLARRPPDALVYANVLAVGHRARVFGRDYSRELDAFARARFRPAASFGPGAGPNPAIGDPHFFLEVRVP